MQRLALCLLLLTSACAREALSPPEILHRVTDDEAEEFTGALTSALSRCSLPSLLALVDIEAMNRRALRATSLAGELQHRWLKEIKPDFPAQLSSLLGCSPSTNEDDTRERPVELIDVRERDQRQSLLFRVDDEGSTYVEFLIGKSHASQVESDEIYLYESGILLSSKLALDYESFASDMMHIDSIGAFLYGDSIGSLPPATRERENLKFAQLMSLGDSESFESALEEFQQRFPERGSLAWTAHKVYRDFGDYDRAHEALARFESELGPDLGIELARVGCLWEADELSEAVIKSRAVAARYPGCGAARWLQLQIELEQGDPAGIAKTLKVLGEVHDTVWTPADANGLPEFANFTETQEWADYQTWVNQNFDLEWPEDGP